MKKILPWFCLLALAACREPFNPPIVSSPNSYLVVEANLNAGSGPTTVRLTRTYKLADTARIKNESNATVAVEGSDNSTQQLFMLSDGIYTSPGLSLNNNTQYRLRIKTSDNREYLSAYVAVLSTPPIDSIGWTRKDNGVQLYVNAQDPANNTRYYRWDFDETWEIRSRYFDTYEYISGRDTVIEKAHPGDKFVCWKYSSSSTISIGSSARLQQDVIHEAPILFVPAADEKLAVRYSMLLRQYALSKEAYDFYSLMKRNTENLGTIFDAQPSEIRGNIQCISDPSELVIGFVTASTVSEKRMFISSGDLPHWNYSDFCTDFEVVNRKDSLRSFFGDHFYSPYAPVYGSTGSIVAFTSSRTICIDCTLRGGNVDKPSYW